MPTSIALSWSRCHLVIRGGGWFQLVGVPVQSSQAAAARLTELGAGSASVIEPGVIQFRTAKSIHYQLASVFPTCPLS